MIAAALEPPAVAAQGFFLTVQPTESTARRVVHSIEFEFKFKNFKWVVPSRVLSFVFQRPCGFRHPYGAPRCIWERHERSCSGLGTGEY